MDLMLAAKALYDRWTVAHKGHNPDGSPMPCWEALSGTERATWTAVAETAYHHVRKHLDAVPVMLEHALDPYLQPILDRMMSLAGQTPGVTASSAEHRSTITSTVANGIGAARVDITVTCGDEVHRMSYEQAVVDISCQPGSRGTPERLQLKLTGTRIPAT